MRFVSQSAWRKVGRWVRFLGVLALANLRLTKRPFKYILVVTKSCNSRCKNCLIWTEKPQAELTLNDYRELARNSPHLYWLSLTGGEPTERDDFVEIVAAFAQECSALTMVNFTTNGIRTERIVDVVERLSALDLPRLAINISLDGPEALHDRLRGVPQNFTHAIETYRRLRGIRGLDLKIAMTLHETNQDRIQETVSAIRDVVPEFELHDLHLNIPHSSEHFYGNTPIRSSRSSELVHHLRGFKSVMRWPRDGAGLIQQIYLRKAERFLRTGQTPIACAALRSSVYISEKGELYPCTIWNRPLGSLKENGFDLERMTRSPSYQSLQREIEQAKCPQCWSPCEAYQSILTNLARVF